MRGNHQLLIAYKVRSGTISFGNDYEFKMAALLALRCLSKGAEDIWLASNADSVGAFDDIICYIRMIGGDNTTYAMQLKHQYNPKNITVHEFMATKGDFSLTKYCDDIVKLKQSIESSAKTGIVADLGEFDNIKFVLFTNRGVNKCKFLEQISSAKDDISMLNTISTSDVYKFNFSKLSGGTNIICAHDCKNLYLICNQAHAKHVNELIVEEIRQMTEQCGLTRVNPKDVAEKLVKYITAWAKGELGGHYYLTKGHLVRKIAQVLFSQYELDLSREEYCFYDSDLKLVWNSILRDKTLTIVDADEMTRAFLKSYIGSEVRPYLENCERFWTDDLSEQAQNIFYQNAATGLQVQMLGIVGSDGKISALDVYKCLWIDDRLPLLIEVEDVQDFDNVTKIFGMSALKVIVLSKIRLSVDKTISNQFLSLSDLNGNDRGVILDLLVKLQGRSSVSLRHLVDDCEQVTCSDIVYILTTDFNVGVTCKPISDYFMKRSLSKIFIKLEALKEIDDVLLVHKETNEYLDFIDGERSNIVFVADKLEEITKWKCPEKIVHRLILHSENCLEWRESFGGIKNMRQYQTDLEDVSDCLDVDNLIESDDNVLNPVRIVSAAPGMGKTTLFEYIAARSHPDVWVLKVNLYEHHEYYETLKHVKRRAYDHLMHFNDAILRKNNCSNIRLAQMSFRKLLAENKILVLLDGFDEISISYKDEVTQIAKDLQAEGYVTWLSTRPVMKSHLEEQLHVIATALQPFTIDEQLMFLTKYFTQSRADYESTSIVVEFVAKLFWAARCNFNDQFCEFTEVPLQSVLLADVYRDEFEICLKTGVVNLSKRFDLLYLYEQFINRKNDILCNKFGRASKDICAIFKKHQQFFALKHLFPGELFCDLDVSRQLEEYYEDKENIQFLQQEGILHVEQNESCTGERFSIGFVHQTFAEYLAAQWLSENINCSDVKVRKCVEALVKLQFYTYSSSRQFMYKVFDCMLARNCVLHLAVIHQQVDEVQKLVKADPDSIDLLDAGGRTILHLMPLYTSKNLDWQDDRNNNFSQVVEQIPSYKIRNIKDMVLGYGPLDYALANYSMNLANKMCEKSQTLKLGVDLKINQATYFLECGKSELKSLFKVLLLHFAVADVLRWGHHKETTIETYCTIDHSSEISKRLIDYAKDFGATTLWELFQFEAMNDLRFTVSYGTKELFYLLLSKGAQVNQQDIYGNTALHYALRHERFDMVKMLLSEGVEIDQLGETGNTLLHSAAWYGYDSIIKKLLFNGADINKTNVSGDTPLHVALTSSEDDTAKLLLTKNAKCNVRNKDGNYPLHYAAANGNTEIVIILLDKTKNNVDVNVRNEKGTTPLHMSVARPIIIDNDDVKCHTRTVQLLLCSGAGVNIQDHKGNTALHMICGKHSYESPDNVELMEKFRRNIVIMLLNKGADVNLKNKKERTVFDVALHNNRTDTISLIQNKCNSELKVGTKVSDCALS